MHFLKILLVIAILTSVAPTMAAEESPVKQAYENVEQKTARISQAIEAQKFNEVEAELEQYRTQNTITRHGTDTFNDILNLITQKIHQESSYNSWLESTEKWKKESPDSLIPAFLNERIKYKQVWHFKNDGNWDQIPQGTQRKHTKTLNQGYQNLLNLIKEHPEEWRIDAYLANNFDKYKLNANELQKHFDKTQAITPLELTSIDGMVRSRSHEALGRDKNAISTGIGIILKKYPDKNLSKPEYIDENIKKEIQDEIFEYTTRQMLSKARKYANNTKTRSPAPYIIPMVYEVIYNDLQAHYTQNPTILKTHPLSYKRQEVWNEIKESYDSLGRHFPSSARYLTTYLESALDLGHIKTAGEIIKDIETRDPNYNPEKLRPMQCTYYSRLKGDDRKEDTNRKMYEACKDAVKYVNDETFNYRAGWSARQIKQYEASNQFLEAALKFNPQNHIYLTDLCWNYKDIKRYDKALDYCDRALEKNNKHARAWLGRSHIYYYGFKNIAQSQKDAKMYERYSQDN